MGVFRTKSDCTRCAFSFLMDLNEDSFKVLIRSKSQHLVAWEGQFGNEFKLIWRSRDVHTLYIHQHVTAEKANKLDK